MKHTCKQGKWFRQEGEEITDDTAWEEKPCQECEPLTVVPEEGLGLICLNSDEPEFKDGTLQVGLILLSKQWISCCFLNCKI